MGTVQLEDQLRLDDSHTLHKVVYYIIGNIAMGVLAFLGLGRLVGSCSYRVNLIHNIILMFLSHLMHCRLYVKFIHANISDRKSVV